MRVILPRRLYYLVIYCAMMPVYALIYRIDCKLRNFGLAIDRIIFKIINCFLRMLRFWGVNPKPL